MNKLIVWCHGGCFSGGSVQYDNDLRQFLEVRDGWKVICVDFSLNDWGEAINDIENSCKEYQKIYDKIVLVGVSSGGMLAHEVANRLKLSAGLLCPVIKPYNRHESLPSDLKEKQLKFFHTTDNMKKIQDSIQPPNSKRYIMYGKMDQRAPMSAYSSWFKNELVKYDEVDGGHELCNKPSFFVFADGIKTL